MAKTKKCRKHHKKLPCTSCRAALGGSAKSARKTRANRKNGRKGAHVRWAGHQSEAIALAKKLGISRQGAYYHLRKQRKSFN